MKSVVTAALVCAVALVATGAASAGSVKVVRLQDIDVRPGTVRITRGSTVEWRFLDRNAEHNVTSRGSRRFRSSPSKRSGTYRVRFRRAGTYRYVCTIHPSMVGKVVVR